MAHIPYYPYPYITVTQYQQPPCQYQPQKSNQQPAPAQKNQNQQYNYDNKGQGRGQNNRNSFGNLPQIDKIPVPHTELVPYLIHVEAIVPKEIPSASPPFRPKHDPNASCAYHTGYIGNSTEDCWALNYKVQDLIN